MLVKEGRERRRGGDHSHGLDGRLDRRPVLGAWIASAYGLRPMLCVAKAGLALMSRGHRAELARRD